MRIRPCSAFVVLVIALWSLAAPAKTTVPDPLRQLGFMPNAGQADPAIVHYAPIANGILAIDTQGRLEYRLVGERRTAILRERFLGARKVAPRLQGSGPALHLYRNGERTHLSTHPELQLPDLWPGIDLTLSHRSNTVEKIFRIEPGADAARIRLRLDGARSLALEDDGRLRLDTPAGTTWFSAPIAYQEGPQGRERVEVAYWVEGNTYGFRVGRYDPARPLIIDPLLASASLNEADAYSAKPLIGEIGQLSTGEIILVGATQNPSWLDLVAAQGDSPQRPRGGRVGFVAKMSRDLDQLLAVAIFGGGNSTSTDTVLGRLEVVSDLIFVAGASNDPDLPINKDHYGGMTYNSILQKYDNDFVILALYADLRLAAMGRASLPSTSPSCPPPAICTNTKTPSTANTSSIWRGPANPATSPWAAAPAPNSTAPTSPPASTPTNRARRAKATATSPTC